MVDTASRSMFNMWPAVLPDVSIAKAIVQSRNASQELSASAPCWCSSLRSLDSSEISTIKLSDSNLTESMEDEAPESISNHPKGSNNS